MNSGFWSKASCPVTAILPLLSFCLVKDFGKIGSKFDGFLFVLAKCDNAQIINNPHVITSAKMMRECTGNRVINAHATKLPTTGTATLKNCLIVSPFHQLIQKKERFRGRLALQ